MRLQLQLSPNTQPIPFNYLHQLTGALHKWLGQNDLHDGMSLYSFGWLQGGERIGNTLWFAQGATWTISFHDEGRALVLAKGILKDASLAWGMKVEKALELDIPSFDARCRFSVDGAVVIRAAREDGSKQYLLWDNPAADEALTRILHKKWEKAGYQHIPEVGVRFDRTYQKSKTRLIDIKGTKHRGSTCPVIVEGPPEIQRFAWLVGVGELTGSGCGALN